MLKILLILLFPTCLVGQDFMNVECSSRGRTIMLNQDYIHIENMPIIRVHCICTNYKDMTSILSYEWRSKMYKYTFDIVDNASIILIALEPKSDIVIRVWEISSFKIKMLEYVTNK